MKTLFDPTRLPAGPLRAVGTACGVALTALLHQLGGWDMALKALVTLMALDVMTGVLVALMGRSDKTKGGGLWSGALFSGLGRKMMVIVMVMLAHELDSLFGEGSLVRSVTIGFYAAGEGLSILENAALMGLPLPKALTEALERMKGDSTRP